MIYTYKCNECNEIFDVWATFDEKEKGLHPKCPRCNSEDTRQEFSAINLGGSSKAGGRTNMPPGCGPTGGLGCC
jgi:putative FmdB family regulatory protein